MEIMHQIMQQTGFVCTMLFGSPIPDCGGKVKAFSYVALGIEFDEVNREESP